MVAHATICLRQLGGSRAGEVRFGRFLANPAVTLARLIEGWGTRTKAAAAGRHVLAIHDTSELTFRTTAARRRGLGEIGRGTGHGLLIHAMLALDAETGGCLGLVAGQIWTRAGRRTAPHAQRRLDDKESSRWLSTAAQAKTVLAEASTVTMIADQESDLYPLWATLPGPACHLLGRAYHDRSLAGGGSLFAAAQGWPVADTAVIELRQRPDRPARRAELSLRFGPVRLCRPKTTIEPGLPDSVALHLVEVVETAPPAGAEPVHWRLLTTHTVAAVEAAWRVVGWYKRRWTIEQLFRTLKQQGLRIEDSQVASAERLLKLAAVATHAAAVTLQLTQARDGASAEPATVAFAADEVRTLMALGPGLEGKTRLQQNPHATHSLAWAAWIIARLGGWKGYPSERPPGPITFRLGLERFASIHTGYHLPHVCTP